MVDNVPVPTDFLSTCSIKYWKGDTEFNLMYVGCLLIPSLLYNFEVLKLDAQMFKMYAFFFFLIF